MQIRTSSHRQAPDQQQVQQQRGSHGKVQVGKDYYDEVGDAKDRDAYYASVRDEFDSADGKQLYRDLHSLVSKGHHPLDYSDSRKHLYGEVDRHPDGGLYYIYSGQGIKNESEFTTPANRELGNYNCEHVVPQSWFHKKSTPRGDLHHLFTEQTQCNGARGNYPLEETPDGESLPSCGLVNRETFEPHAGKGEVARATLYFITRYPGEVGDSPNETQPEDIQQLLKWSREYPVTDYERHRNDVIQNLQGNRNPFVDFPELAEKVDFSAGFGH